MGQRTAAERNFSLSLFLSLSLSLSDALLSSPQAVSLPMNIRAFSSFLIWPVPVEVVFYDRLKAKRAS